MESKHRSAKNVMIETASVAEMIHQSVKFALNIMDLLLPMAKIQEHVHHAQVDVWNAKILHHARTVISDLSWMKIQEIASAVQLIVQFAKTQKNAFFATLASDSMEEDA